MPFDDGYFHPLAKFVEPAKLVVDERLQRADVENRESGLCAFRNDRQYRQKRRFGLPGRRCRGDQYVFTGAENCRDCSRLNFAQFLPALIADPLADQRMQPIVSGFKIRFGDW